MSGLIHKFSMVYDAAQDRIAFDAEDGDEEVTRLWLTQRLCRLLVGAVVPMLVKADSTPPEHQATVQSWEQVAAMADFGKVPPVKADPQAAAGLVTAVHITPHPGGWVLKFDFGEGDGRAVDLTPHAVRQTLAAMHGLQAAAGWPLDFWPDWVADPAALATVGADAIN